MSRVTDSRSVATTGAFQRPNYTEQLFIPAAYSGVDVAKSGFSLQTIFSTLFRYRVLILSVSIITICLAALFTRKVSPTYKAQAMVSVGQYIPPILGPTGRLLRETTSDRNYVADQLPLITSYTLAELVLNHDSIIREYVESGTIPESIEKNLPEAAHSGRIDLDTIINSKIIEQVGSEISDAEKKKSFEPNSKSQLALESRSSLGTIKSYLNLIDFEHVRNTSMVSITAESERPALAARIANVHSQVFIALVRAKLIDSARINLKFLQDRKLEATEKAQATRKSMLDYAEANNILVSAASLSFGSSSGVPAHFTPLGQEYQDLIRQAAHVTEKRAQAESEHRALQASGSDGGRFYAGNQDRTLAIEYANKKAELRALKKSGIASSDPYFQNLQREVSLYKEIINTDRKSELKDHEVRMRALREQENIMLDAMRGLKERSVKESKTQLRYSLLVQEDHTAQSLLAELTERLEEIYIHLNSNQSHVRMVDEARAPNFSKAQRDYVNLILATVLGPFMGIALAFALDLLDNTVRTVNDLQRVVNVPLLGIIPRFSLDLEDMIASSFQALPEGESVDNNSGPPIADLRQGEQLPGLEQGPESGDYFDKSPSAIVGGPSLAGAWSTEIRSKLDNIPSSHAGQTDLGGKPDTKIQSRPAATDQQNDQFVGSDTAIGSRLTGVNLEDHGTTLITNSSLVLVSAPHSVESEAFRNVRTCVTYGCTETPPKIVLVTSGQKSDGKTTVACNLAISLAQVSERTLLIDADLRLPAIHKNFSLSRLTPGLSDYLRGFRDYGEVIFETPIPNLCLMLAGEPCPNPTELVGSKRMAELLELLTDEFDHIIIDSPPVTRVADAMLLSRLVEGVVLVIRSGKTPEPVAENAFQRLRQMDANILGTVLNDVVSTPGYRTAEYYYLSESYYGPDSYSEPADEQDATATPI